MGVELAPGTHHWQKVEWDLVSIYAWWPQLVNQVLPTMV